MDQEELKKQLEELRRKHQDVIEKKNAQLVAIKELSLNSEEAPVSATTTANSSVKKVTKETQSEFSPELSQNSSNPAKKVTLSTQNNEILDFEGQSEDIYTQTAVIELDERSNTSFDCVEVVGEDPEYELSNSSSEFGKLWSGKFEHPYCATDCHWRGRNEVLVSYKTNLKNHNGYIVKYDINSPGQATKFECTSQPTCVTSVPRSNDLFIVGGNTGLIFLYDAREKVNPVAQSLRWNSCHTCQVIDTVFISDSRFVSVAADGSIYMWELDSLAAPVKTEQELHMRQYKSQGSRPTAVTATDINSSLLIGLEDGTIVSKGIKGSKEEEVVAKYGSFITGLDFRPGSKGQRSSYLVSSLDGVTEVVSNEKSLKRIESFTDSYVACAWQPLTQRQAFCACRSDGIVGLYDLDDEDDNGLTYDLQSIATCCKFSSDGRHVCVGTIDENITILNCPTQKTE